MVRERPEAVFLLGTFYAESLILAETGHAIGAIQIAGTKETSQLPFFVAACDYTLIGEELFAASSYLSREPVMLGSLKGQDLAKIDRRIRHRLRVRRRHRRGARRPGRKLRLLAGLRGPEVVVRLVLRRTR